MITITNTNNEVDEKISKRVSPINRETICTRCVHGEVCLYKQTYLKYLRACEKLHDEYPDDISFIRKKDPVCKFNKEKSEINFR